LKFLRLLCAIAALCPLAHATDRYVSSSTGSDSNPGTISQPWKTLAKLQANPLQPCSTGYLKRGDTWAETISISSGGSAGCPVTLADYGVGSEPRITGVNTNGAAVSIYLANYVTIHNIWVDGSYNGIGSYCSSYVIYDGDTVSNSQNVGMYFGGNDSCVSSHLQATNDTVYGSGYTGISDYAPGDDILITRNWSLGNVTKGSQQFNAGIRVVSDGSSDAYRQTNVHITNNHALYNGVGSGGCPNFTGYGIHADTLGAGMLIADNESSNNACDGIMDEWAGSVGSHVITRNVVSGNGGYGLINYRRSHNTLWLQNTSTGNAINCGSIGEYGGDAVGMVGNIWSYNRCENAAAGGQNVQIINGAENDGTNGSANSYQNFTLGVDGTAANYYQIGASTYSTAQAMVAGNGVLVTAIGVVIPVGPMGTSISLTASATGVISGASVTFTAKVTPSAATGTVTFKDGTTTLGTGTLSSGATVYSTTALAVGTHRITATYSGDGSHSASSSAGGTVAITVTAPPPQTSSLPSVYLDTTNGSDANPCVQADSTTPLKTVAKLNTCIAAGTYNGGGYIYLKRGTSLTDDYLKLINTQTVTATTDTLLTKPPTVSGSSTYPIVITAYGTGPNPILNGWRALSCSWTLRTDIGAGVYVCPNAPDDPVKMVLNRNPTQYTTALVQVPNGGTSLPTYAAQTPYSQGQLVMQGGNTSFPLMATQPLNGSRGLTSNDTAPGTAFQGLRFNMSNTFQGFEQKFETTKSGPQNVALIGSGSIRLGIEAIGTGFPVPASETACQITGTTLIVTASNTFTAGTQEYLHGFTACPAANGLTLPIATRSATQVTFTLPSAPGDITSTAETTGSIQPVVTFSGDCGGDHLITGLLFTAGYPNALSGWTLTSANSGCTRMANFTITGGAPSATGWRMNGPLDSGSWYASPNPDGTTYSLYVHTPQGDSPANYLVEYAASSMPYGVLLQGVHDISISELQITGAWGAGIYDQEYQPSGSNSSGSLVYNYPTGFNVSVDNVNCYNVGSNALAPSSFQPLSGFIGTSTNGGCVIAQDYNNHVIASPTLLTGLHFTHIGCKGVDTMYGNAQHTTSGQGCVMLYGWDAGGSASGPGDTVVAYSKLDSVNANGLGIYSSYTYHSKSGRFIYNEITDNPSAAEFIASGVDYYEIAYSWIHDGPGFGLTPGNSTLHAHLHHDVIDNIGLAPHLAASNGIDCNGGAIGPIIDHMTIVRLNAAALTTESVVNDGTYGTSASDPTSCHYAVVHDNIFDNGANPNQWLSQYGGTPTTPIHGGFVWYFTNESVHAGVVCTSTQIANGSCDHLAYNDRIVPAPDWPSGTSYSGYRQWQNFKASTYFQCSNFAAGFPDTNGTCSSSSGFAGPVVDNAPLSSFALTSASPAVGTASDGGDVGAMPFGQTSLFPVGATIGASPNDFPSPTAGTTEYVRPDGGTPFVASNIVGGTETGNPTGQCDGLSDLPASGATGHHCAWNSPEWAYSNGSRTQCAGASAPQYCWRIAGGDTLLIRGSIGSTAAYRVGWPNASGAQDSGTGLYHGLAGDNVDSGVPPPPSGTSTQHTRILGENYGSCSSQSARTQIHGGYGVDQVIDLRGASYVDLGCLDLTDYSGCTSVAGGTSVCNKTAGTLSDFATSAVKFSNTTTNVNVTYARMHGLAGSGIQGPTGTGVQLHYVDIIGNGNAGFNADLGNGTTGTGTLLVQNYNILWNGCAEEYPIVDSLPYSQCADDFVSGGYGDGFGTTTAISNPGWQVTFDQGTVAYNTQDGLDADHLQGAGSSITITRTLAYGNMGQQIKIGGTAGKAQNNVIATNCRAMAGTIPGTPSGYNSLLSDFCRAQDTGIVMTVGKGTTTTFSANTVYSAAATTFEVECDTTAGACDGTSLMDFRDNIFLGFQNSPTNGYPSGASDYSNPIYIGTSLSGLNPFTASGAHFSNNLTYHAKSTWTCPATGETGSVCADPLLADETWHLYGPPTSAKPGTGSPAIGAGVALAGVAIDFNGNTRGSADMGAVVH
jgi:hypothetical protein